MKMTLKPHSASRLAARISLTLALLALAGCATGVSTFSPSGPPVLVSKSLTGSLHGGQQPVSGASIQLYAVGITGLQSASTPLLATPALTNSAGFFTLPAGWNCTSNPAAYGSDPLLYIVATGGNPGLGSGGSNPALAAMAVVGPCSSVTGSTFLFLNEVTSVAAVYALSPFMADLTHIGALGSKPAGLLNAFATAALLANTSTGTSPGAAVPANTSIPTAQILTLANLIAPCINSSGSGGA